VVHTLCGLLDELLPDSPYAPHKNLITYVADRPGHDRRYAIDCAKIQSELGWSPRESFETGLAKTVDWYLANRGWTDDITKNRYSRERLGSAK
jgi:dTDP-glucose 4,6-dehydratase